MNKRKVTKRKGSKLKSNNDPGEVFVLPPNLLEELGINLGNIETAPQCTSGNQVPDKESILKEQSACQGIHNNVSGVYFTTTFEKESSITQIVDKELIPKEKSTGQESANDTSKTYFTKSSEKESSIIQTANLMKESVFLSPTFISNNRSIIEGEVEIVGNTTLVNDAMSKLNASLKNNEYDSSNHMMQGNTIPNQHHDTLCVSNLENPSNSHSSVPTGKTNNNVQATHFHIEIDNAAKEITLDDHADEAYSSDCSNSNVEFAVKSDCSNSSDLLPKQNKNNNNKINIISEQILDPSQFKAFKSSYSIKDNDLIPVTMNTVLKSSYKISSCCQSNKTDDLNPNMIIEYVPLSEPAYSDLCDLNEQNSVNKHFTVPVLRSEPFNASNNINQNDAIMDTHANYFNHNMLLNVSEDIVTGTQVGEGSSQCTFKVHISGDLNPNMISEYVALSEPVNSDICNVNKQNSGHDNITVPVLKTDSLNANNNINENVVTLEDHDDNFNRLSNISENIVISIQMQQDSSQHAFEVDSSSYYQNNITGDLNPNIVTEYVALSGTIDSNFCDVEKQNSVYEDMTATALKRQSLNANINLNQNAVILESPDSNSNILSNISADMAIGTQTEEALHNSSCYQNNLTGDLNTKMITAYVALPPPADSDFCDVNDQKFVHDNVIVPVLKDEPLNANNNMNQNALTLDSHDNNFNRNKLSNVSEAIAIAAQMEDGSSQHKFKLGKSELNIIVELPCTSKCGDKFNAKENNLNKIVTKYEETSANETSQKINAVKLDEPNFHVNNKQQNRLMKVSPVEVNTEDRNENSRESSHDTEYNLKRQSKKVSAKYKKFDQSYKDHLPQNSVNNQRKSKRIVNKIDLNLKVKDEQVINEVKKQTSNGVSDSFNLNTSTNVDIKEMFVGGKTEPVARQSHEELQKFVKPNKPKKVQSSTESLSKSGRFVKLGRLGNIDAVQEDKIREIAGYLSKFADMQKRKKIFKERHAIRNIKTSTNKKHATNSKLSIQGVEKPGGSENNIDRENDKNIKTYERKKKNKIPVKVLWNTPSFDTHTHKINLTNKKISNTCNDADVCLCDDFGRLRYYDNESMYEHIHYWNRNRVDCSSDLIFGIYNDNVPAESNNDMRNLKEDTYIPNKVSSIPDHRVCWNEIKFSDSPAYNDEGNHDTVINFHDHKKKSLTNINRSSVDEKMKPDVSNYSGTHATNIEDLHKTEMVTVNQLENCIETVNNNIVPDGNSKTNKKKRKYSSCLTDSNNPPAKKHVLDSKLPPNIECDVDAINQTIKREEHQAKIVPDAGPDSVAQRAISLNRVTSAVCGVCRQNIKDTDWIQHIASQHNYLSWRADEAPLDLNNRQVLIEHLSTLLKQYGALSCNKCGITRKYAKPFLQHINQCDAIEEFQRNTASNSLSEVVSIVAPVSLFTGSMHDASVIGEPDPVSLIKCGVCGEYMQDKDWISHMGLEHNYLAWKQGDLTLNVDDETAVRQHLYNITKEYGGLKCAKCGLIRKYVKSYLTHIKSCDGLNESQNESALKGSIDVSEDEAMGHVSSFINNVSIDNELEPVDDTLIKCGVCGEYMQNKDWNCHIESVHNYLAWKHGEPSLNVEDEDSVREHLYNITKECGGLKCAKCGLSRKYVKSYLSHVKNCNGVNESRDSAVNVSLEVSEIVKHVDGSISNICIENQVDTSSDPIQCAVCGECMDQKDWYDHIGLQHNYLAWKCGEPILDFDDEEMTQKHLYAITKEHGGLKCAKCGLIRKYVKSYLTHVKSCTGLSDSHMDSTINASLNMSTVESVNNFSDCVSNATAKNEVDGISVKCGVCGESIRDDKNWYSHIGSEHNYLAWKCGEPALDIDDEDAVREHLHNVVKQCGGLKCTKCGLIRKYVKSYLTHFKTCDGLNKTEDNPDPVETTLNIVVVAEAEQDAVLLKCGVCGQYMPVKDWAAHIASAHNYLAWKEGETPIDISNDEEVRQHLQKLVKEIGTLACLKCGLPRKYVKSYLQHVQKCDGSEEGASGSKESDEVITPTVGVDQVKCGVCNKVVKASSWIKHIAEQHDYLAKKVGEIPLDVDDKEQVYDHLYDIVKEYGELSCQTCGTQRKYVKSYLEHIKKCGQDISVTGDTIIAADISDMNESLVDFYSGGTCGVCEKEVEPGKWIQHIQKDHNYLAWRKGEKPWDLEDFTEVNEHLYEITKKMDGLTCNKCGMVRKYVKTYLTHIRNCTVTDFNLTETVPEGIGPVTDHAYRCAMCRQEISPADWRKHALKEHYNITWIIGQTPIDIKNPYAVEKYLKEYRQYYGLRCNSCGATRTSFAGFYAHVITCGKTEEQIEMFQSVCNICNNKYLCIYKNQHMMTHRVQEYSKLKMSKEKKEEKVELIVSGKRRAAQKARSVIENYSSDMGQHSLKCSTCGFGTDFKEEMQSHRCDQNEKDFSEDESSASEGHTSEEESADSEVDSDISREEEEQEELQLQLQPQKKKRYKESVSVSVCSKMSKIPFKVENPNSFVEKSDIDFCNAHLTDDTLFPKWLTCKHEVVAERDLPQYLPPMEESCKIRSGPDWTTLKRFEAQKGDGTSIFVGACIVSIAWIPLRVEDIVGENRNFLAVACHNDVDSPRYQCDETPQHANLIQIWDFGACTKLPQIVYGIAHDFGTVWSMDWCPSGARSALPEDLADSQTCRLGLLAIACSNGSAYIFSVPYPSTVVKNNHFIHKLRPVAELRMTMSPERKLYQATSVTWSKGKGHTTVLVGYADGSTAYYDLNCESPLLRTMEDTVEIFYPYHDERPHNTCVAATDMYPGAFGAGAACSAGATGAALAAGAGRAGGAARARSQLPARAAAFAPHWPAALLAGDAALMKMATNELEWTLPARKLGGVSALAGCARCGRVAAVAAPALCVMRPHPAYAEFRKPIVGMLEMLPLRKKIDKQVNDELAMKIEPLTYVDAVSKYGLRFQSVSKRDKALQQQCAMKPKTHFPERFPLADVKSMAFCPAKRHHEKLAVATHSGVLFFINVNC